VTGRIYLTIAEVLAIHWQQISEYGGDPGLRDKGLLESAVFRPQVGYYAGVLDEAAALMESLMNNHPFVDGNKRVAFSATHAFLLVNGYDLRVDPTEAYEFVMTGVAKGEFRFGKILEWIRLHAVTDG
jgi:death-on-curing protein